MTDIEFDFLFDISFKDTREAIVEILDNLHCLRKVGSVDAQERVLTQGSDQGRMLSRTS